MAKFALLGNDTKFLFNIEEIVAIESLEFDEYEEEDPEPVDEVLIYTTSGESFRISGKLENIWSVLNGQLT